MPGGGRGGAAVRMLLAYPCSPYLLTGPWLEWLLFAGLYLPLPFLYLNRRWMKRHTAYWDGVREREKELRRQKQPRRSQPTDGSGAA